MANLPGNIPQPSFENLFLSDPLGPIFFAHWSGGGWGGVRPHLEELGRRGALATPLSAVADREGPTLMTHDARGERVDRILYHPAYRELEALAYGGGIVALKYDPDFLARHRALRHLAGFAGGYYFAQSEIGVYCPVTMTDGIGRVLERYAGGGGAQGGRIRETLSRLAERDPARLWQGSMYLTERQGGSDVGANTVQARQDPEGTWRLRGDKWFCSNVDAAAMLVLARMPEGPPGTRGLGLFLVLRPEPPGNAGAIRIHRLKDKLGVRSMATGEVSLEDAEGVLLAGTGEGFKAMTEMVNLSRLYNAVASVALMRRAVMEAAAYGRERHAFGTPLWTLPLWRAVVADIAAEHLGQFVLVFEAVRALDRADGGDALAGSLARMLIPIAKGVSGKAAVWAVSEAMEAIGGNAYIEESLLPRLLRDSQVLPIWEGTTNILALDTLRVVEKERGQEALFARGEQAVRVAEACGGLPSRAMTQARGRLHLAAEALETLRGLTPAHQQRGARQWMDQAGRALSLALLLEAAALPSLREPCLAAFHRLEARGTPLALAGGMDAPRLADTEGPLLEALLPPQGE